MKETCENCIWCAWVEGLTDDAVCVKHSMNVIKDVKKITCREWESLEDTTTTKETKK